jgi:hypothetical protein
VNVGVSVLLKVMQEFLGNLEGENILNKEDLTDGSGA